MGKDDENWAAKLFEDWFQANDMSDIEIAITDNDPPDLAVSFRSGEVWGIEVTRVYRRVAKIGGPSIVGSPSVMHPLERFGRELDEETKGTRQQNYSLFLRETDGIGARVRRSRGQTFSEWKSAARESIVTHIECRSGQVLEGPGFTLRPSGNGNRWFVGVSSGSH